MPTEQEILKAIRKIIPNSKKYLFDDAAIIEKDLIITTDTLVENTHFTVQTPRRGVSTPEEIGWKAMAVNLSDIAAMGGKPLYALISLSLPTNIKIKWIENLYKGLIACAKKYKTQIIGGNLARSKEINITIAVIGKAVVKASLKPASIASTVLGKRSNARPGDLIFTTGTFGDSACGFLLLKDLVIASKAKQSYKNNIGQVRLLRAKALAMTKKHKTPIPQISLGQKIVRLTKRVSLMDASDGLADSLIQIANQSNVKIIIDKDKIPLSQNIKKATHILNKDPLSLALYGGEDYQLVGTASKIDCKNLEKLKGVKIIGKVIKGNGAFLKQNNNRLVKLDVKCIFKHFT